MTRRSGANEIPKLVRRLGSRSPARVDAARARLSIIGARSVEHLVEALEGDNNQIRARVMPLLALIQDRRGREPLIFGDGKQSRDFTYVDNIVDANILATQTPKAGGEVLNVACGTRVTILGLASFIGQILGRDVNPRFEKARAGDVRHSLADVTKAREFLGYRPRFGIEEGLKLTVEWFRKHGGR